MFTGIIESIGIFRKLDRFKAQWSLEIEMESPFQSLIVSESICVNGVCLTVKEIRDNVLIFDLLNETYAKTNLSLFKPGSFLNLERSLKVGDRIGGHFITGHVDGTGEILNIEKKGEEHVFSIQAPRDLTVYLVYKGSIAIEGVSLTFGKIDQSLFEVYLIPYTLAHTNLGMKKAADRVNLEVDILARYVLSSNSEGKSKITEKFLEEHGF